MGSVTLRLTYWVPKHSTISLDREPKTERKIAWHWPARRAPDLR